MAPITSKSVCPVCPVCPVCCDKFTEVTRRSCGCPKCNFKVCVRCVQSYLLTTNADPHCMQHGCHEPWTFEFTEQYVPHTFIIGEYKRHREHVLYERERALMPITQHLVVRERKIRRIQSLITEINEKTITPLERRLRNVCTSVYKDRNQTYSTPRVTIDQWREINERCKAAKKTVNELQQKVRRLQVNALDLNSGSGKAQKRVNVSTSPCPKEGCNSFLNNKGICEICDTRVCKKCRKVLDTQVTNTNENENENEKHTCNDDDVKTTEMIAKECRACPKCAVNIFKIDGCDQIFCTACHTAFSWRSGKITVGRIHNPHYYDWLRASSANGEIPREHEQEQGDANTVLCPDLDIQNIVLARYKSKEGESIMNDRMFAILRAQRHIEGIEMTSYTVLPYTDVNRNLKERIAHMIGDTTVPQFKRILQQRDKHKRKQQAISDILEVAVMGIQEILRRLVGTAEHHEAAAIATSREFENLIDYYTACIKNVSNRFNCVVPIIRLKPSILQKHMTAANCLMPTPEDEDDEPYTHWSVVKFARVRLN